MSPFHNIDQHLNVSHNMSRGSPMIQDNNMFPNQEMMQHFVHNPIHNNQMMNQNMSYPQQMFNQGMTRHPNISHSMINQPQMHQFGIQPAPMQPMNMHHSIQPGLQNLPQNLIHNLSQMHPNMMHLHSPIPTHSYNVDAYVNTLTQPEKPYKRPENKHPASVPVFVVDISSHSKLMEFKEERRQKVVERLGPYLPSQKHRDDLEWSISEIRKSYENQIAEIENKHKEMCQNYFRENHRVTVGQASKIFKWVRGVVERENKDFDRDLEFQSKAMDVLNDIINDQLIDENPNDILAGEGHEVYQDNSSEYTADCREDLENFLVEVRAKKQNMKDARENIINKVQGIINEVTHIVRSEIYGSYQTNLDLPWSDIDFVIFSETFSGNDCLDDLNIRFTQDKHSETWIKRIDYISSASVPIIKMITEDKGFEVKVDITFGDETHKGSDCVKLGK